MANHMQPRDSILSKIRASERQLRAMGVMNLWLFGSSARDEPDAKDADFLVEFADRPTFMGFMDLKFFLEEKLQMPVDLHTRSSCPERFMRRIQPDLLHVA